MNGHGDHERLSAFYDGELSAVERAEVERLLAEQPDLRAELVAMTDLSQRMTDLANEGVEFDLVPDVMRKIKRGREQEGQYSKGHPLTNDEGPGTKDSPAPLPPTFNSPPSFRHRWMPSILAVCSLGLLMAATLPLLMKQDAQLAMNSPTTAPGSPAFEGQDIAPMSAAPAAIASHEKHAAADAANFPPGPPPRSGELEPAEIHVQMQDDPAAGFSNDPSDLLRSLAQKQEIHPGEMIRKLVNIEGQAMVAEFLVVDVRRSQSRLDFLLQAKGIAPLEDADPADSTSDRKSGVDDMRILVIDAPVTPLYEALEEVRKMEDTREVLLTNVDSESLSLTPPQDGLAKQEESVEPGLGGRAKDAGAAVAMKSGESSRSAVAGNSIPKVAGDAPSQPAPAALASQSAPDTAQDALPEFTRNMTPKAKAAPNGASPSVAIVGNSFALSNGTAAYPVLEEAARNSINRQNAYLRGEEKSNQPFRAEQRNAKPNARDLQNQSRSANSPLAPLSQNADLQYGQRSMNRLRQLAFVILKTEPKTPAAEGGKKP